MADTWQTIKSELEDLLDDATFTSAGSFNGYLRTWSNRIVKDICLEIDIRDHLETVEAELTGGNHMWLLPSDFLKMSERFTKFRIDDTLIDIIGLDELNEYDPNHDETGTTPTAVSIEGTYLYSYPACTCDAILENYLRQPTDMTATSSSVDLPWIYYVTDMVVAGVAGKYGFPWLAEYEQAGYWEKRYRGWLDKYAIHLDKSNSREKIEGIYY